MAIKVVLKRKEYTSYGAELQTRINVGLEILQAYMRGYFEPLRLETWSNAPLEELGGTKIDELELNIGRAREIAPYISEIVREKLGGTEDLSALGKVIFRIYGKWNLDGVEPEGFLAINQSPIWKNVYGDVDIDAYPTQEHEDFMDMFWQNRDLRMEMINAIFEDFIKRYPTHPFKFKQAMDLSWICFAEGVPSPYDIPSMKAVYYSSPRPFIQDIFNAFKKQNEWVQESLKMKYVVSRAYELDEFKHGINSVFARFGVKKKEGGSIMFIADEPYSFKKLYEELSSQYLKPLFTELPRDEIVKDTVKRVTIGNPAFRSEQSMEDFFVDDNKDQESDDEE